MDRYITDCAVTLFSDITMGEYMLACLQRRYPVLTKGDDSEEVGMKIVAGEELLMPTLDRYSYCRVIVLFPDGGMRIGLIHVNAITTEDAVRIWNTAGEGEADVVH